MLAQIFGSILHVLWCFLFVEVLKFDVEGLGYAVSVTQFINLVFTVCYSNCLPSIKEAIHLPNASSLQGWGEYLRLGIPTMLIECSDWWAFEILLVLAGFIGVN